MPNDVLDVAQSGSPADRTFDKAENAVNLPGTTEGKAALSATKISAKKIIIKKTGLFAAFFRPIGLAIGLVLAVYGLGTLGTNYWRSYNRHLAHIQPVHFDKTIIEIFAPKPKLSAGQLELLVRDADGYLRRVAADKSKTDSFVHETLAMLMAERGRIKMAAAQDLDRVFDYAFADREQVLNAYADWFFEWKRSYVVLKETITSTANRFMKTGEYESLREAVERDVKDYFMRHYSERVLKPEIRDQRITEGLETSVRRAHENYRRVIANSDARLQLFLARYTRHLEDVPKSVALTNVKLDWDAQKWKSPTHLAEDKAFEGIAGLGTAAAGGTIGALVLGPAMSRAMAGTFAMLSRRFATSIGTRLAFAEKGAIAGTFVEPLGGQIVGAVVGVVLGTAADYFMNKANEKFSREKFINANTEALDATISIWRDKVKNNVASALDAWFDEAQASVVLAQKAGPS
ncbi:hypothetical protein MnTg02_02126 [bacterium MnTg02]|nr:hypothetical protein MnTg02_02126 [bacterium MnTg02]